MNLAKVSANGQITVPVEIRRLLGLRSGDKVLFSKYSGTEVKLGDDQYIVVRQNDILAVVED